MQTFLLEIHIKQKKTMQQSHLSLYPNADLMTTIFRAAPKLHSPAKYASNIL